MEQDRNRRIYRVTLLGSVVNMLLLIAKFAAGILGHSAAMIADAVRSLRDLTQHLTTRADDNHAPPVTSVRRRLLYTVCQRDVKIW